MTTLKIGRQGPATIKVERPEKKISIVRGAPTVKIERSGPTMVTVVRAAPAVSVVKNQPTVSVVRGGAKISISRDGVPGPRGGIGPQGPQGPAGGDTGYYYHVQSSPSSVWTIQHNMGYRPAGIRVYDSADTQWEPGNIEHVSNNELIITWSAPFSGRADLS